MKIKSGGNVRAHVWISGRVQAVFFRSYTRTEANLRGINGWVRNLEDGRVEAVFEGDRDSVDEILEFCKKGPEAARVEHIEVKWEKPSGKLRGFEIKY